MGIFDSLRRYFMTLGGLIGGDIDKETDRMLTTQAGVKATFKQTREKWTKQYSEVREAVAQLMMVIEQKRKQVEETRAQVEDIQTRMKGAVRQYKETKDPRYQQAFNELYGSDQELVAEQERLDQEIRELHGKVDQYKARLQEMQGRIQDLDKQEAAAIADIVSSQQIISLNDRLNNMSTELDDQNLKAVENSRAKLVAEAKLSDELAPTDNANLDRELRQAGMRSEAADLFAAMVAEDTGPEATQTEQAARERDL